MHAVPRNRPGVIQLLRNLKLSAKLGVGFGIMIAITAVLGVAGWRALSETANENLVADIATQANEHMYECDMLRRDVASKGHQAKGDDGQSLVEHWEADFDGIRRADKQGREGGD